MPVLKIKNAPYYGEHSLKNVVSYIFHSGHIGGLAVDPQYAVYQMQLVKQIWHKTEGRQVRHFILSFSEKEFLTYDEAIDYGYQICRYFSEYYQIIFGIHLDTQYLHIHFALNTVSYIDGHMFSAGPSDYWKFRNYIQGLMPQWYVELGPDL